METTDLWNGTHLTHRRRLYAARLGRVLLKRPMKILALIDGDTSRIPRLMARELGRGPVQRLRDKP